MTDTAASRRARQTLINLVLSLGASLGLVLLLVLLVPRDDSNRLQQVNYQELATQAQSSAPGKILVPDLRSDWYANVARYRTADQDGVANWYVGFVGPNNEFIAMTQGFEVNPTWINAQLESAKPIGGELLADYNWEVYQNPNPDSTPKSKDLILLLKYENNSVLVYGVAPFESLVDFARSLSLKIETQN